MSRALRYLPPLAAVLVLLAPAEPGGARPRKPKPSACPPGRFLVQPAGPPLLPLVANETDVEVLVVDDGRVALDTRCPMVSAKIRATRRLTKLTVLWPACGQTRRVRLTASIAAPGCTLLRGTLRGRKLPARRFTAVRST